MRMDWIELIRFDKFLKEITGINIIFRTAFQIKQN